MLLWRKFGDVFNVLITWFYERLWWILLMGLIQLAGGLKIRADVFLRKRRNFTCRQRLQAMSLNSRLTFPPACLLFQICLVSPHNSISQFLVRNLLICICPSGSPSLVELWLTHWCNNLYGNARSPDWTNQFFLFSFSPSATSNSKTPWTAARQASLSFTIFQSVIKPMSIELVMPSNHFILCCPLLLPSIFPSIRSFPTSRLFASGGQSTRASTFFFYKPILGQNKVGRLI